MLPVVDTSRAADTRLTEDRAEVPQGVPNPPGPRLVHADPGRGTTPASRATGGWHLVCHDRSLWRTGRTSSRRLLAMGHVPKIVDYAGRVRLLRAGQLHPRARTTAWIGSAGTPWPGCSPPPSARSGACSTPRLDLRQLALNEVALSAPPRDSRRPPPPREPDAGARLRAAVDPRRSGARSPRSWSGGGSRIAAPTTAVHAFRTSRRTSTTRTAARCTTGSLSPTTATCRPTCSSAGIDRPRSGHLAGWRGRRAWWPRGRRRED